MPCPDFILLKSSTSCYYLYIVHDQNFKLDLSHHVKRLVEIILEISILQKMKSPQTVFEY